MEVCFLFVFPFVSMDQNLNIYVNGCGHLIHFFFFFFFWCTIFVPVLHNKFHGSYRITVGSSYIYINKYNIHIWIIIFFLMNNIWIIIWYKMYLITWERQKIRMWLKFSESLDWCILDNYIRTQQKQITSNKRNNFSQRKKERK